MTTGLLGQVHRPQRTFSGGHGSFSRTDWVTTAGRSRQDKTGVTALKREETKQDKVPASHSASAGLSVHAEGQGGLRKFTEACFAVPGDLSYLFCRERIPGGYEGRRRVRMIPWRAGGQPGASPDGEPSGQGGRMKG